MTKKTEKLRLSVVDKVRRLRQENKWTQTRLASLLGLSQNRLSEIERGHGSFTAEQLLLILQTFNTPLSYFAPDETANEDEALQNALAHLGATHLRESRDVLPTEKLAEVNRLLREVLVSRPSPRLITALAPAIARHARYLNIDKLLVDLSAFGYGHRLAWVLENILEALHRGRTASINLPEKYEEAKLVLQAALVKLGNGNGTPPKGSDDVLEQEILRSEETREAVSKTRSKISRKWGIISRIQPEDFSAALEEAHETP